MASFITLTPHPLTISLPGKGSIVQPLWTVVNVSAFDILDLELGMLFLSSRVTATVSIDTGMQNQIESAGSGHSDGDWQLAGQFAQPIVARPNTPPTPQWQKLSIVSGVAGNGFLKLVRWRVNLSAAGTATFFIRGLARRLSR